MHLMHPSHNVLRNINNFNGVSVGGGVEKTLFLSLNICYLEIFLKFFKDVLPHPATRYLS